jgi:hypothetical protein
VILERHELGPKPASKIPVPSKIRNHHDDLSQEGERIAPTLLPTLSKAKLYEATAHET